MQRLQVMLRDRKSRTYLNNKFDGDTCSLTPVMSEEGIDEVKTLLNSKNYYVGVDGKVVFSSENDISKLVFAEMSN